MTEEKTQKKKRGRPVKPFVINGQIVEHGTLDPNPNDHLRQSEREERLKKVVGDIIMKAPYEKED